MFGRRCSRKAEGSNGMTARNSDHLLVEPRQTTECENTITEPSLSKTTLETTRTIESVNSHPLNTFISSLSGGRLILPERLGSGRSGTGGLLVSESVSVAVDCDRSGTATSVDGTPCTEDEPNSLFGSLEISSAVSA
ncbi:hypothetical protein TNCT_183891 [Trichonephila clavata]|uniref:Uncharacterized protein n=1 Tax=Trichonephila clavata TaxID=2740835 RepID=A0A8X6KSS1_TRICU|nr:hypothetical protein TNCT_183891 [Trichonephila clavata]